MSPADCGSEMLEPSVRYAQPAVDRSLSCLCECMFVVCMYVCDYSRLGVDSLLVSMKVYEVWPRVSLGLRRGIPMQRLSSPLPHCVVGRARQFQMQAVIIFPAFFLHFRPSVYSPEPCATL